MSISALRQVLVVTLDLVGERVAAPLSAATVAPLLAVIGNVLAPQAAQISSIGVGSVTVQNIPGQQWAHIFLFACSVRAFVWSNRSDTLAAEPYLCVQDLPAPSSSRRRLASHRRLAQVSMAPPTQNPNPEHTQCVCQMRCRAHTVDG